MGYPPVGTGWVTPCWDWMGYQDSMGYPYPGHWIRGTLSQGLDGEVTHPIPGPHPGQVPGLDGRVPLCQDWMGYLPIQDWIDTPIQDWIEYPPAQDWMGYPSVRSGWGTPHPGHWTRGTPSQVWMGKYPIPSQLPIQVRSQVQIGGTPPVRTGWGTPSPNWDWMGHSPIQDWIGYPLSRTGWG